MTSKKYLEKLEKENQSNKDLIKIQNEIIKIKEEENSKLIKVIDLLVHKSINTLLIRYSKNLEKYNEWASKSHQLTQEEYDLLKEYL